jgi:plastocyanin
MSASHTRHWLTALLAGGTLVVLAGCGDTPEGQVVAVPSDKETSYLDNPCSRPNSARLRRFHVTDDGFQPRKVVIRAGTPVAFINCGTKAHTVTKVAGRGPTFDSGPLKPRAKIERTFAYVGTQKIVDRETGAKMTIEVGGMPGQPQS